MQVRGFLLAAFLLIMLPGSVSADAEVETLKDIRRDFADGKRDVALERLQAYMQTNPESARGRLTEA